jgi:hypothetical protein
MSARQAAFAARRSIDDFDGTWSHPQGEETAGHVSGQRAFSFQSSCAAWCRKWSSTKLAMK